MPDLEIHNLRSGKIGVRVDVELTAVLAANAALEKDIADAMNANKR